MLKTKQHGGRYTYRIRKGTNLYEYLTFWRLDHSPKSTLILDEDTTPYKYRNQLKRLLY